MYKDPYDERAKAARRKHYEKNKEVYKANAAKRKREMQQYVWAMKSNPCMDCGIQYLPWVMQFDHRPEEVKVGDFSKLVNNGSWTKLLAEIEKCDLVCANCHIIRTATRANWKLDAVVFTDPRDAFSTFPKDIRV
jgi:CO dehydrogenase/acetyl-CoA synthase alpha subunit